MDYDKLSKNIKSGSLNLSTFMFCLSLFVSFVVVYSYKFVSPQLIDMPDYYLIFVSSVFGIVMISTITIGVIRLMMSEMLGINQIIGGMVAFLCVNLVALFMSYIAYAGERLEDIGITSLYFDNGFIVSLLDIYSSSVFFSKWSIVITLTCMMMYYASLLYDKMKMEAKNG